MKKTVKPNIKMADLNLPPIPDKISKGLTMFRRLTKRAMMNDYFNCLEQIERRLARTKFFEDMLNDPDYSSYSAKPTPIIKKLDLRNLDYLHCLHAPKKVRPPRPDNQLASGSGLPGSLMPTVTSNDANGTTTTTTTTCSLATLAELFNSPNPFDIFSKFPQFNQGGNQMQMPIKEANYTINLFPFVPIKLKTEPGEKPRYYAHKLVDEVPGEINIFYHYIRDYKFLISEKSKFPFYGMSIAEKQAIYNTIIDSASLGIDQMILHDTTEYTEEDDQTIYELRNGGELIQFS